MLCSSCRKVAAEDLMTISEMLLPEFDQEMANTRKILERVPEDKVGYKPHEKSMALGRLASHTAELPSWVAFTIQKELLELQAGQQPYSAKSRKELLEKFDENVTEARQQIAGATDEDLQKTWTMKFDGQTVLSMPRAAVLRSVIMNHMIHHRAQLGVYLRLNEIEIPGMYGPSADEMKFWEPQAAKNSA
jgi:uncharacterized damage-inducible protein DinB